MTEENESMNNKTCPLIKVIEDLNMGFYKVPNLGNIKAPDLGYKTGLEFSKKPN